MKATMSRLTAQYFSSPMRRRSRRGLVILTYALFVLGVALHHVFSLVQTSPLTVVLFILVIALPFGRLYQEAVGIAYGPYQELDERQKQVQNRAYRLTYGFLFFFAFVPMLYMVVLRSRWGDALLALSNPVDTFITIFAVFLFLLISLPVVIIAWTEPEPVEDDLAGPELSTLKRR